MSRTINYDRPVNNLIDELSATGHVTHNRYKKTSVTLHHNGIVGFNSNGRRVLEVWKTREASAHFSSDLTGDIAQFVDVHEYAWACGNTEGNMRSIHIEMSNSSGAPKWEVSEASWRSSARLAGWLFAHVIKARPSRNNFFVHHHWYATTCAGPYIDAHYGEILLLAQQWYDRFHADLINRRQTMVEQLQAVLEIRVDNVWGPNTDARALMMRVSARRGNVQDKNDIKLVQRIVNTPDDGVWGPNSRAALTVWIQKVQRILNVRDDGVWGPNTDRAFLELRKENLAR